MTPDHSRAVHLAHIVRGINFTLNVPVHSSPHRRKEEHDVEEPAEDPEVR